MNRRTLISGAVVAAMMLGASSALAGTVWGGGSADDFTYSNGHDDNGHFGVPLVDGNSFYFMTDFLVNSQDGEAVSGYEETQTDTVYFNVQANTDRQFSFLRIYAFGDYAVTGDTNNSVEAAAGLSITETGGMMRNWSGPLATSPTFPVYGTDSGIWDGVAVVDFAFMLPVPHDNIDVALSTDVIAITTEGGSATINAQYDELQIEFITIPEPASLSILAVGGVALLRRRR